MDGNVVETSQWGYSLALIHGSVVVNVTGRIHIQSLRCRVISNSNVQRRWRPLKHSKNQSIPTAL